MAVDEAMGRDQFVSEDVSEWHKETKLSIVRRSFFLNLCDMVEGELGGEVDLNALCLDSDEEAVPLVCERWESNTSFLLGTFVFAWCNTVSTGVEVSVGYQALASGDSSGFVMLEAGRCTESSICWMSQQLNAIVSTVWSRCDGSSGRRGNNQ